MPTRVAGIEMTWPSALINVNNVRNGKVSGGGTIDGRGQRWWSKYAALRKDYDGSAASDGLRITTPNVFA